MYLLDPLAWSILLLLMGCALVVMEVFIPSGGIISMLAAVVVHRVDLHCVRARASADPGFLFTAATVIAVPTMLAIGVQILAEDADGQGVPGRAAERGRGLAGRSAAGADRAGGRGAVEDAAQRRGGDQRPNGGCGHARPGDRAGAYVVVVEVRANRVVVRPAGKDQRPSHVNPNDLLSRPIEELGIESLDDPLA